MYSFLRKCVWNGFNIELNEIPNGVVTVVIDNDIEMNDVEKTLLINIKDNAMSKLNEIHNDIRRIKIPQLDRGIQSTSTSQR